MMSATQKLLVALAAALTLSLVAVLLVPDDKSRESERSLLSGTMDTPDPENEASPRRGRKIALPEQTTETAGTVDAVPSVSDLLVPGIRGHVVDAQGHPVAQARVELFHADSGEGGRSRTVNLDSIEVGRDGSFEFIGRFEGLHTGLRVLHSGFAEKELPVASPSQLLSGAYTIQLDAGLELSVRVIDAARQPIADAEVFVASVDQPGQMFSSAIENSSTSGKDGVARVGRLSAGKKVVYVSARGYSSPSKTLQLKSSMANEIRFVMEVGRSISGTVVDTNGQGIALAVVFPHTPQTPGVLRSDMFAPVRTDANGAFESFGVPAGFVSFSAEAPGYSIQISGQALVTPNKSSIRIVLKRCEQKQGRLVLRGEGSLPEKFVLLMTRVPSSSGSEVAQARVITTTDGSFQYAVPPRVRSYYLHVLAEGHAPATSKRLLAIDEEPVVMELVQGGQIEGRVVDGHGDPVRGAVVGLFDHRIASAFRLTGGGPGPASMREVRTRKDGRYSFERIPVGDWRLHVHHGSFAPFNDDQICSVTDGAVLTHPDLRLSTGGGVKGQVFTEGGDVAAGAVIRFYRWGEKTGALTAVTASDGRFRLERMAPGRYRIQLAGNGNRALRPSSRAGRIGNLQEVTVVEGELVTIRL